MPPEFDHLFICSSCGGAEADVLAAFGLTEGAPNVHPGQGTACRRFFFANSYLELLWVSDASEVQSADIQPTRLWERWSGRAGGVCPFGLAFRPQSLLAGDAPFSSWDYRPPYLPAGLGIQVATNSDLLTEPMLFYLPFRKRPDRQPGPNHPPPAHRAGLREVTRVTIVSPHANKPSPELAGLTTTGLVQFQAGPEYLIELGFDRELQGQHADFRPSLPLVFHW